MIQGAISKLKRTQIFADNMFVPDLRITVTCVYLPAFAEAPGRRVHVHKRTFLYRQFSHFVPRFQPVTETTFTYNESEGCRRFVPIHTPSNTIPGLQIGHISRI